MLEQNPPALEAPQNNVDVAPNIDAELDAALSKSFSSQPDQIIVNNPEKPIEEPKKEKEIVKENVNQEVKPEPQNKTEKNSDKPSEKEKPILTPEEVEKIDPKDKGAWGAIKNSNKRAHVMIEQKDAEISKLKATIAEAKSSSQKELEAIRAEKAELEKYRAMVDIQADPEFVSKYDKPLESATTSVKEMLKGLGVSDESLSLLNFNDTETLDKMVSLVSQKDRFKASKLERAFKEVVELMDKRNGTISEHQKNYKETLEKKKQESFAKSAESEGRMIKHLELKASEVNKDGHPLIPFLNRMEPKENATQAEIDQANQHNNLVDLMGKKLQSVIKMKEPEQQAEIAIAAVASHYLMAQLNAMKEQLRKAQEELKKMNVVTSETATRKPPTVNRNGNNEPVDIDTALSDHFRRSR